MKPIELSNLSRVSIVNRALRNAPTLIRLIDCHGGRLANLTLSNPTGPPDPDGQCIQLIRPRGRWVIEDCTFTAGPRAEDLLSIYGAPDEAAAIPWTAKDAARAQVIIRNCRFQGRGRSNSSTSICADGPHPPPILVENCTFESARVGIMIAGGRGHTTRRNLFTRCKHNEWVQSCYGTPIEHLHLEYWPPK